MQNKKANLRRFYAYKFQSIDLSWTWKNTRKLYASLEVIFI